METNRPPLMAGSTTSMLAGEILSSNLETYIHTSSKPDHGKWQTKDLLVGVAAVCLSELTIAIQQLEVVVLGLQAWQSEKWIKQKHGMIGWTLNYFWVESHKGTNYRWDMMGLGYQLASLIPKWGSQLKHHPVGVKLNFGSRKWKNSVDTKGGHVECPGTRENGSHAIMCLSTSQVRLLQPNDGISSWPNPTAEYPTQICCDSVAS